jgi:hypothetical protein
MKKVLLAISFTFLCIGLVNAQTKEETISWLKGKLGSYLKGLKDESSVTNIYLESLNECEFKISYVLKWEVEYPNASRLYRSTQYVTITAPTSIESLGDQFWFSTKAVNYHSNGKKLEFDTKTGDLLNSYDYIEINEFRRSIQLQIEEREAAIRERVEKAFKHLATFCPKKKEIF